MCEDEARFYTGIVLLALEHLHSKKIVYRDLKPEVRETDCTKMLRVKSWAKRLSGLMVLCVTEYGL